MGKSINPVITAGTVIGTCPKCGQPYTGKMDADDQEVVLACVGCNHKGIYKYHWPEELPKVQLRHKSNGQLLGPRRKSKKKKPKGDPFKLKGQLCLPGVE